MAQKLAPVQEVNKEERAGFWIGYRMSLQGLGWSTVSSIWLCKRDVRSCHPNAPNLYYIEPNHFLRYLSLPDEQKVT